MQSSNDQFERLRELLTCKNVGQPAPDYFEELPTLVRERIESLPPPPPPSSFERLMAVFELRPVLGVAYGVMICGGVFMGLRFSDTLSRYPLPKPEARDWAGALPFPLQSPAVADGGGNRTRAVAESFGSTGELYETSLVRATSGLLFVTHGSNLDILKAGFQP